MRRWCNKHAGSGVNPAPTLHFSAEWRARTSVRPCEIAEVDHLVKAHYLHRRPGVVTFCVVMETDGIAIGMVMFALPPRETSVRYGGLTWELARLFITDDAPCNSESWLIAQSIRLVRAHHPHVENLVSYADPSVGHTGVVYKASNWIADGPHR